MEMKHNTAIEKMNKYLRLSFYDLFSIGQQRIHL